MSDHTRMRRLLAAAAVAGLISPAAAQHDAHAGHDHSQHDAHAGHDHSEHGDHAAEPWVPSWSDATVQAFGEALTGSWKTQSPVVAGDGSETDYFMHIAPVHVDGLPDTLYVEAARSDDQGAPFRSAIFQIYRYRDGLRLRTYEVRRSDESRGVFAGLWAAPAAFPDLSASDLIATIDVDVARDGSGFSGASPYPYPTGIGGAVEMTSRLEVDGDRLVTADTGYAADGSIAWGAGDDGSYTFVRTDAGPVVIRPRDGMTIIEWGNPGEEPVDEGDIVHVHYIGWLADGRQFDASRQRGRPYVFRYPSGSAAIEGWGVAMEDVSLGTHRKVMIPGNLAYGPAGNPRAGIGPNADLYFDIEVVYVEKPAPPAQPEEAAEGGSADSGG